MHKLNIIKNGLQSGFADFLVEIVSKRLDINVDAVQHRCQVTGDFRAHIAVADKDVGQPGLAGQDGGVPGVFEEDGRLGIGVGDKVLMLENTWYSVISPENCSSILWRSWEYKEQAAEALKLTATDMKKQKLIDTIIKEPLGGAHSNREEAFKIVEKSIVKAYGELNKLTAEQMIQQRMKKYANIGVFNS